jgi:hypothetical protein
MHGGDSPVVELVTLAIITVHYLQNHDLSNTYAIVEWIVLLTGIREVLGSNSEPEMSYTDCGSL